jgi:Icc-related predicted phosphoesterase
MTNPEKIKLQIVSDLHLEFSYITMDYSGCDILIFAGDIHSDIGKLKKYILAILKTNKSLEVIVITGNHEHYSKTVPETIEKMTRLLSIPRCHFLQNSSVEIHGLKFIGSTLWCNPPTEYWDTITEGISDFSNIKNFSMIDCIKYHEESLKYIEKNIDDNSNKNTIIITHFLPSFSSINDRFKITEQDNILNHYYATDLEDTILYKSPRLWIHGHTHAGCSYYIGDTRIVCNPRGYSDNYNGNEENRFFDRKMVIEL